MKIPTKLSPLLRNFTLEKELKLFGLTLAILGILVLLVVSKASTDATQSSETLAAKEAKIASLSTQVKNVLQENTILKNEDTRAQLTLINNTLDKYLAVKDKSISYKSSGVSTSLVDNQFPTVVDLILAKKYAEADSLLSKLDADLETALKAKQAADLAAKPKSTGSGSTTCSSLPTSGYCRMSVSGYTVHIVAGPVSAVRTITGNAENCTDQCAIKSLQSYISDNGGYAGMNGTYFCPPDYSTCSGKVNSFDFPVYNSNLSKWINEDKMLWTNRAMIAFTSSNGYFYSEANSYSGLSGIKAGIVNYPGLVQNGQNIVSQYTLTSAQNTKGTRGGIAVKGSTVYLVVVSSASVSDFASVMTSLGVTHALNLDGGGSSALYSGGYKIGPGRSLPNAVILK